jgi:hypothetical protein
VAPFVYMIKYVFFFMCSVAFATRQKGSSLPPRHTRHEVRGAQCAGIQLYRDLPNVGNIHVLYKFAMCITMKLHSLQQGRNQRIWPDLEDFEPVLHLSASIKRFMQKKKLHAPIQNELEQIQGKKRSLNLVL